MIIGKPRPVALNRKTSSRKANVHKSPDGRAYKNHHKRLYAWGHDKKVEPSLSSSQAARQKPVVQPPAWASQTVDELVVISPHMASQTMGCTGSGLKMVTSQYSDIGKHMRTRIELEPKEKDPS